MRTRSGQIATTSSKVKRAKAGVAPSVRGTPKPGSIGKSRRERVTSMAETKNKAGKQGSAKLRQEQSRVKSMAADRAKKERAAANRLQNAAKKAEGIQTVHKSPKKNAPHKTNAAANKLKGNSSVETKRMTRSGR